SRRGCREGQASAPTLDASGDGARGGRLAPDPRRTTVRPLALLVAGAPARLPYRCPVTDPRCRAPPADRPTHPRDPAAQWLAMAQRLLRRHGLVGPGSAAGRAG